MIPSDIKEVVMDENYQMLMISSEYKVASDEVNDQCDKIEKIMKKYDKNAMLIGEAPCTKDLITITNHDFNVVSTVFHRCDLLNYCMRIQINILTNYLSSGH